jgi:hypothetical protein
MTLKQVLAIVGPYLVVAVGSVLLFASHSADAKVAAVAGLALALMNHNSVYLPPPAARPPALPPPSPEVQ